MANVELILMQRVEHLGQMGEVVRVKPGYARNYLLPQKKAIRATKENLQRFESQRAQLEAQNIKRREEAERLAERMAGLRSREEAEELHRGIAGAMLETVAHTGHMIPLEQPKALARVMTEWLKTLSRRERVYLCVSTQRFVISSPDA